MLSIRRRRWKRFLWVLWKLPWNCLTPSVRGFLARIDMDRFQNGCSRSVLRGPISKSSDHRMCAKLAIYMIYNLDYHWILPFPFLLLHKQAPQVTKYIRLTTQTEKCFKGYKTVIATELKTNLFLWKVHPAGGGPLAAQRVHAGPGWAQLIE